jgi:hypothetical protein
MAPTEKELMERDAKRNLGEELLQSIRDVKAGRHGSCAHHHANGGGRSPQQNRPVATAVC